MFYVYAYVDPRTNLPFYVGKGSADRDKYHLWNVATHPNSELRTTIQELRAVNQQPIITRVFEVDDEQLAFDEEKRLIEQYGRRDMGTGTLCNKTPGGEGFGNTGTTWSSTQRQKMKQKYLDRSPGESYVRHTLEGVEDKCYKNPYELRMDGYTPTQIMAIRLCCRGERYSVKGYRWRYGNNILSPNAATSMKAVSQFTKTGEFIRKYVSVTEAGKHTGINQGDIASVARGNTRMKSAGGFVWSYS